MFNTLERMAIVANVCPCEGEAADHLRYSTCNGICGALSSLGLQTLEFEAPRSSETFVEVYWPCCKVEARSSQPIQSKTITRIRTDIKMTFSPVESRSINHIYQHRKEAGQLTGLPICRVESLEP